MSKVPLSRLGYGCYAMGGAYGAPVEVSRAIKLIVSAFDLGIRLFDTADQYGTEEVLGKAVQPFRNKVAIATKVGADLTGKGALARKNLLAGCEASLRRLNTDYIDLYQVHYDDPETPVAEVVETLELLKDQGKIRSYGVGHLPLARTREYLETGSPETVLAEMNAASLNRYKELHPLQQTHSFGIIAFSVTGRGLLTGKISPEPRFADTDIRRLDSMFKRNKLSSGLRIMQKLADTGNKINATPAQMAIAWVLSKPGITAALTGPTNPGHLRENCAALDLSLDPALQEEISAFISCEEEKLKEQINQEVWSIVNGQISDWRQTAGDLIYVLEHCIEEDLIPYNTGVDLFTELLQIRKTTLNREKLHACKETLRDLLESTLPQ